MVFTHVLVGVLVGAFVAPASPGLTVELVGAGLVGGLLPDVDMLFVHRKTLHFPVLYALAAGVLGVVVLVTGSGAAAVPCVAAVAAALHCAMDTLGGGKEMRPWRETDERAVYNHVAGEWVRPRRLFYDGSLPDLALSVGTGAGALWVLPGRFTTPVLVLVGLAVVYTGLRRTVTELISEEYTTFSGYIQSKLR